MKTHTFTLPSGIECEVKPLLGIHQRWLTEDGAEILPTLQRILADVVVRLGTETKITPAVIEKLPSVDRKKALVEIRQFTVGFKDTFLFEYQYKSKSGNKETIEMELDLSGGFNEVPMKIVRGEGDNKEVVESPYKEVTDIEREHSIVLPMSEKKITFCVLDGVGESIGMNTPKKNRSSHTSLYMRQPREETKTKAGDPILVKLDLDKLPLTDLEYLRATIKDMEGSIDTEYLFEHPEAELKPAGEKEVVVDLISTKAFFFPSQAI